MCVFISGLNRVGMTERKQCTQSSHSGRHSVYTASRRSSATYSCSRPKTSRRVTKPGSFSEIWIRDLQLLESGSEKILRTVVRESEVNRWLYVLLICSERRLRERSNWLTCQIFKGKINIREDKLLLYNCLLELDYQKSTYLNTTPPMYSALIKGQNLFHICLRIRQDIRFHSIKICFHSVICWIFPFKVDTDLQIVSAT
jgi:hypothetical protein